MKETSSVEGTGIDDLEDVGSEGEGFWALFPGSLLIPLIPNGDMGTQWEREGDDEFDFELVEYKQVRVAHRGGLVRWLEVWESAMCSSLLSSKVEGRAAGCSRYFLDVPLGIGTHAWGPQMVLSRACWVNC